MNIRAQIFGEKAERLVLKDKQGKKLEGKGLAGAIVREESRRANDRDQDRYRLINAACHLTYEGIDYEAEVVNLSGGGAMIAAELEPNIGDRLHLRLGGGDYGSIECAVRWIKAGRLGLEFAHETQLHCSEDEQAEVLRDVINRDFPDQKFTGRPTVPEVPATAVATQEHEHRAAMRHPLIWSGELHHGSHRWQARLRNISSSGVLLECNGSLRVDSEVLLDLGKAGSMTACVSWAVGDHVGLIFDEPFDLKRLSEAKPRLTPKNWSPPTYLESDSGAQSPWERMSIDDLRSQLEGFLKR